MIEYEYNFIPLSSSRRDEDLNQYSRFLVIVILHSKTSLIAGRLYIVNQQPSFIIKENSIMFTINDILEVTQDYQFMIILIKPEDVEKIPFKLEAGFVENDTNYKYSYLNFTRWTFNLYLSNYFRKKEVVMISSGNYNHECDCLEIEYK